MISYSNEDRILCGELVTDLLEELKRYANIDSETTETMRLSSHNIVRTVQCGTYHIGTTAFPSETVGKSLIGRPQIDLLIVVRDDDEAVTNLLKAGCDKVDTAIPGSVQVLHWKFDNEIVEGALLYVCQIEKCQKFILGALAWRDRFIGNNTVYRRDYMDFKEKNKLKSNYEDLKQQWFYAIYSSESTAKQTDTVNIQVAEDAAGWDTDTESDSPTGREMMTSVGLHTYN